MKDEMTRKYMNYLGTDVNAIVFVNIDNSGIIDVDSFTSCVTLRIYFPMFTVGDKTNLVYIKSKFSILTILHLCVG